jgi:hypothetical protein
MTAKEFLESEGIDLNKTAFLTVVDGYMRQPDLCVLMEKFLESSKNKAEYQDRREPFNPNV